MRVDTVPFWLKPCFNLWGHSTGTLLSALIARRRRTLHIDSIGPGLHHTPAIYCIWHEDLVHLFVSMPHLHQPQVWMNHPMWYMKPVHVFLAQMGITKLALGSTGHGGQAALERLAHLLRETGASTTLAVDGPNGPPYHLRKGCLYLAQKTGLPIVPIRFMCTDEKRYPFNWDKKRSPKPGATLTVQFGDPIWIAPGDDVEAFAQLVINALGPAGATEHPVSTKGNVGE